MTHADIYIKFMIEYDKANVASSYPSLTEYEVATVLDKAYNALIAQKITGNNFRRSTFESDVKAIADLQPLIVNRILDERSQTNDNFSGLSPFVASNTHTYNLPMNETGKEFLYFLLCYVTKPNRQINEDGNLNLAISYLNNKLTPTIVEDQSYELNSTLNVDEPATVEDEDIYTFKEFDTLSTASITKKSTILILVSGDTMPNLSYVAVFGSSSLDPIDGGDLLATGNLVSDQNRVSELEFDYDPEEHSYEYLHFGLTDRMQADDAEVLIVATVSHTENQELFVLPIKLLNHELANQFYVTGHNLPWIKDPICYLENNDLIVVSDALDMPNNNKVQLIYIKKPNLFVKSEEELDSILSGTIQPTTGGSLTRAADAGQFSVTDKEGTTTVDRTKDFDRYKFELNDTMAEELISLAIAFALENVESPRLNSRLNMRGLEA